MADNDQDQKTEQPTEKKLSEAIDRGQFARSPEVSVLFLLVAVLGVLGFTARTASQDVAEYAVGIFTRFASTPVERDTVTVQLGEALLTSGRALAPMLLACIGAALLAGGIQSGFRMAPNAIGFKPENLDPIAGFGRLFNKSAYVKAGVDILKLIAIGAALFSARAG